MAKPRSQFVSLPFAHASNVKTLRLRGRAKPLAGGTCRREATPTKFEGRIQYG